MSAREGGWRAAGAVGAAVGYGCLAGFIVLLGSQVHRWFKEGEWPHVSLADGIRATLNLVRLPEDDTGSLARFAHWLDAPVTWLGLHKAIELLPASLAVFLGAILGNFVLVYSSDRLRDQRRGT